MARIVIKATKFARNAESDEVFEQRGWKAIFDQTTIPNNRKLVDSDRHSTSLFDVEWEEWEYE